MKKTKGPDCNFEVHNKSILGVISHVIDAARKSAARSVNCIMTAAYWLIGRRIVESEQKGEIRAEYGDELIERLAADLSVRHGGGFSVRNVWQMKAFYLAWPIVRTLSAQSPLFRIASSFSLPWSAYVRLMSVKTKLRGGWSVRQLDRQINSQFYERTAMPGDHRPENRETYPRGHRPDAPLSQLCQGALGPCG